MERVNFIRSLGSLALSGLIYRNGYADFLADIPANGDSNILTLPEKKQVSWQAAELGMIFHYDISIFGDRLSNNNTYKGGYDPAIWNPSSLDTDQWIRVAKECGCKYAVLTATHFQGFLNWSSDLYPYGMKQAPWKNGKGDLVELFINSCHKFGLQPGLYMSTHRNFYQKVDNFRVNWGKGGAGQKAYNTLCEKMVEELCSRYGKLFELWFDAGNLTPKEGGPDVLPIVDKYQPDVIYYGSNQRRDHRWCGRSDEGLAGDPCWSSMIGPDYSLIKDPSRLNDMLFHGVESGKYWSPAFSGLPLCKQWFWQPDEAFKASQKSATRLLRSYYETAGRNANLVFGATPDRRGLIPEWQEKILLEFGKKIKQLYASSVQQVSGKKRKLTVSFTKPKKLNYVIIQEDIIQGERIRSWKLEGRVNNGLKQLAAGRSIGNKRIVFFAPEKFEELYFTVDKEVKTPVIQSFVAGLMEDGAVEGFYND